MIKGNIIVEQKTNEDGKFHKRNERANIVQIILKIGRASCRERVLSHV